MSEEQQEALNAAAALVGHSGDIKYPCKQCHEIAAALLEARADGRLNDPPFGELTLEYVKRLRAEAAALRVRRS